MADLHCGHQLGLTPPDWAPRVDDEAMASLGRIRARCWQWYAKTLKTLSPIDVLIANGDLIDGKGARSGGTELLTADRSAQVKMAAVCLNEARAKAVYILHGTPYHTGTDEDWEGESGTLITNFRGIDSWSYLSVNGLVFDIRHHLGTSQIPHGRFTALAREQLWNVLIAERGEYPYADVLVRSHTHYHAYCGGAGWLALTTPALQISSKFVKRRMSGTTDYGLLQFDVVDKGNYAWKAHLLRAKPQPPEVVRL